MLSSCRTEISGFEFGRRRPGRRALRGAAAAGRSASAAGAAAATTAGEARAAGAFVASAASAVASAAATVAGAAGAYSYRNIGFELSDLNKNDQILKT